MPLAVGQILQNDYRILGLLGQGGMGAIYLAEHTRLAGRRLAIKENVPNPTADPQTLAQLRQQFYTEARTLAGLDHPNLPKVFDYFIQDGNQYLVMDYVEGENLQQVLDRHLQQHGVPLPEKLVLIWADQVLDALEYLHGQQPHAIIHRDIKPSNIVLTHGDRVKLVDFGLVKLFDPQSPDTATVMQGLGTPAYTPLEQYSYEPGHTDARTDIYALGATLYHLLTGTAPAEAPQRVINPASLVPPRQLNPALTPAVEAVILRAIAIAPDQRFQTAAEMRQALAAASGSAAPQALPTAPTPTRPFAWKLSPGWLVLLAGGALLLAGLFRGILFLLSATATPSSTPAPAVAVLVATPTASLPALLAATNTPMPLPTNTPVPPTDTPTPSRAVRGPTPLSSATPLPTATPTATETPTPLPDAVVDATRLNLRAGPGTIYPVRDSYARGTPLAVLGKNPTGDWLQVKAPDGKTGWMATSLLQINLSLSRVAVVETLPTPQAASAQIPGQAPIATKPTASQSVGHWVLVADSVADFPGPIQSRKWWYVWSVGRYNFEWQDMAWKGDCYRSPNDWGLEICRDTITPDGRGDVALLYKAQKGGRYRFDWQAEDTILFYKHLEFVSSGKTGSEIIDDVIDWELFFFVARGFSRHHIAVQVYRWEE